jgi:hypothetical protein
VFQCPCEWLIDRPPRGHRALGRAILGSRSRRRIRVDSSSPCFGIHLRCARAASDRCRSAARSFFYSDIVPNEGGQVALRVSGIRRSRNGAPISSGACRTT